MASSAESVDFKYLSGFNNHHETEALPGALPKGRNTPQKVAHGLYAEQLSGTAFTMARDHNRRSWLYRKRPSVAHSPYSGAKASPMCVNWESDAETTVTPAQTRWRPFPITTGTFVEGLHAICGAGSPALKTGLSIYTYSAAKSMEDEAFYSADGEFLIVPEQGSLTIQTELGWLHVKSGEIVVIPRGIHFAVKVEGSVRGYACEVFQSHFVLPDRGPIGANGLANERDFLYPVAAFEERACDFKVTGKFRGKLFELRRDHSVFNVVAWHGNYAPYKYDLATYCAAGSITFDHLDPSIFTVLTAPSAIPGTAVLDFVIFPPRWAVQEDTFRPPYFHKNCMSEFMGLIRGVYEAKKEGFLPGGASLHSCMSGHGPDKKTFDIESELQLVPQRYPDSTLAFMFESSYLFSISNWASQEGLTDPNYMQAWAGL